MMMVMAIVAVRTQHHIVLLVDQIKVERLFDAVTVLGWHFVQTATVQVLLAQRRVDNLLLLLLLTIVDDQTAEAVDERILLVGDGSLVVGNVGVPNGLRLIDDGGVNNGGDSTHYSWWHNEAIGDGRCCGVVGVRCQRCGDGIVAG